MNLKYYITRTIAKNAIVFSEFLNFEKITKFAIAKSLHKNYIKQHKRTDYKNFRESKPKPYIDGTWDDHDYGVNDAGKDLNEKNLRQNLFLNFLEVPLKSKRRTRKGMYSTFQRHTF